MPPEMTPDEISFFESGGELPAALAEQHAAITAPIEAAPEPAPEAEPVVEVAPVVAEPKGDSSYIEQLLQEERAARAALEQRINELTAARDKPAPVPEPDAYEDPLGAMLHKLDQVNADITNLKSQLTAEQQASQQKAALAEFTNNINEQKNEFKKSAPDFDEAYAYIRGVRTADLEAVGCPAADIKRILLQDEFQLAQAALQRGKNAAAEMYNMAKRYGYAPKAVAAPVVAKPAPSARIEQLKAGQEAALQPGKSSGVEADLTLEGIKDMSNANLNKLVSDDKLWSQIVGGNTNQNDIF